MSRNFFTIIHRYAGLGMAFFLIIAGLTGSLLSFYHEIDEWLNPGLFRVVESEKPMLGAGAIARSVEAWDSRIAVSYVPLDIERGHSVNLGVSPRQNPATGKPYELGFDEVFVNPYDGSILGVREWGAPRLDAAHIMPFVYRLHYSLHIPGNWGVWLFGIVALVWMFDCFVGFYLTLPRGRPFFQKWRPAWKVKTSAGGYRVNYDLHRAGGLWLWGVLFVISMSSVYFNLHDEVFRPVVSVFGTLTPHPVDALPKLDSPNHAPKLTMDDAVAIAPSLLPKEAAGYEPSYIGYEPEKGVYRVSFDEPGRREEAFKIGYQQVFLDADTGEKRADYGYAAGTAADKFLAWQYPMHTGQILGLPGRILICITGLATAMLSVTGAVIWLKKRAARARRRVKSEEDEIAVSRKSEAVY